VLPIKFSATICPSYNHRFSLFIYQWIGIDLIVSIGLSSIYDGYKLSRALRPVRKAVAKATGLHGFISRKQYTLLDPECIIIETTPTVISIDEELGIHDVKAIEAELLARKFASRKMRRQEARKRKNNNPRSGRRWGFRRRQQILSPSQNHLPSADIIVVPIIHASPDALDESRLKRVEEIDRLLHRGNERLLELQCERDDLLCAPNPLFNYTKKAYDPSINTTFGVVRTTRQFNFPPQELVDEYSKFQPATTLFCYCWCCCCCCCNIMLCIRCNPPRADSAELSVYASFYGPRGS
jgi:hypothetical protein